MAELLEKLFPTLRRKIAVAIVFVLLLAGSAFVYFAHQTGYSILEQQSQAKAHSVAELVRGILAHVDVDTGGGSYIREVLALVTSTPDVADAFILSEEGTVIWSAHPEGLKQKHSLGEFHEIENGSGEKYLPVKENEKLFEYVIAPLRHRGLPAASPGDSGGSSRAPGAPERPPGGGASPSSSRPPAEEEGRAGIEGRAYFGMKISMDDIRAITLGHRTMNIVMTGLTFFGLGVIIFLALRILVIKPIGMLHSHIRRVQGGIGKLEQGEETRFPLLPEPKRIDEVADLFRDFNNLLGRLNTANATVHELHQRQLEHADRLATVGEIAASMAHEIKNPIAGVLGALQVFGGEVAADDPRKEILTEMMVQLERVNHAVNDLLAYARPNPPFFEPCQVNDLIKKTTSLLAAQLKGKHVTIESRLDPDLAPVEADRKQLQQVIWNVTLNGLQAIEAAIAAGGAGNLTVSSLEENSSVLVRIRDTGVGMSREQLEQIFRPFFTTKHKGTGLGMTVSRRIVEQHHGSIAVESAPGEGTTITLLLPKHQPPNSRMPDRAG